MPVRKLVYWPNKQLSIKSIPVNTFNGGLKSLAEDLVDSLFFWGGIGLAAIQINSPVAAFVISPEIADGLVKKIGQGNHQFSTSNKTAWLFINPRFTHLHPGEKSKEMEGCLSFPNIFIPVARPADCVIEAEDIEGNTFSLTCTSLLARAVQHEYEHLEGHNLSTHLNYSRKEMIKKKMRKWKRKNNVR